MKMLAFIPARGGSKGIPNKNLFPLAGKPLIQYTIEAARQSRLVDRIFLSTDAPAIRDFAASLGLEADYLRPPELAADQTPMIDTVLHGLDWLAARGELADADAVVLLQPTSPLRTAADIDGAIAAFRESGAVSLTSVHEVAEHPYECVCDRGVGWEYVRRPPGGPLRRRQDYREKFYYINGAIYINRVAQLRAERAFVVEGQTVLYQMSREHGIDIDRPLDLLQAGGLLSREKVAG